VQLGTFEGTCWEPIGDSMGKHWGEGRKVDSSLSPPKQIEKIMGTLKTC